MRRLCISRIHRIQLSLRSCPNIGIGEKRLGIYNIVLVTWLCMGCVGLIRVRFPSCRTGCPRVLAFHLKCYTAPCFRRVSNLSRDPQNELRRAFRSTRYDSVVLTTSVRVVSYWEQFFTRSILFCADLSDPNMSDAA
jgi:hypothetical protein